MREVRRRLVDDALDLGRREVAGDRPRPRRSSALAVTGAYDLPAVPGLLERGGLAAWTALTFSSSILSASTVKTLSRFSAPSGRDRLLRVDEVDVGAQPAEGRRAARAWIGRPSSASPRPRDRCRRRRSGPECPATRAATTFRCALRGQRHAAGRPGRAAGSRSGSPAAPASSTVFRNRSRLPWTPSQPFVAKSESPMTATRVSGFGASAPAPLRVSGRLGVARCAAASVRRSTPPRPATRARATSLSLSSSTGFCVDRGPRVSRLGPALRRLVSTNVCARAAVGAALHRLDRPRQRVGRDHAGSRSVIGCEG